MCLTSIPIGGIGNIDCDSAAVVFDTIVPAGRPVVGRRRTYEIDVREFVVTERNAVVRRTLERDIAAFAAGLDPRGRERLTERGPGCFDFRVRAIVGWVLRNVRYRAKAGRDPWQFPEETLVLRSGDCEDIAFLVASLMLASGISGYHTRVALGHVRDARGSRFDHAWVLYKAESGSWRLVEPLAVRHAGIRSNRRRRVSASARGAPRHAGGLVYQPSYLFNADHLWAVGHDAHPGSFARIARRSWSRMNPKFAGDVHRRIVETALEDVAPEPLMRYLRGRFRNLLVATIDDSDWLDPFAPSTTPYDPLDHFDNGCIDESWTLVEDRLAAWASKQDDFESFAQAVHGIADFYAHSSWLCFAWIDGGSVGRAARLYPGKAALAADPDSVLHDEPWYGAPLDANLGLDFDLRRFTKNRALWRGTDDDAVATWDGAILSGRYAQGPDDASGSFVDRALERLCRLPGKWAQPKRGALPHHDEIAVDAADRPDAHRLFAGSDGMAMYRQQFEWRVNTAVRHVRTAFSNRAPY